MPSEIVLKKDAPVVFEFTAEEGIMGFRCTALKLESDMIPGKPLRVAFTPRQVGRFAFHCNVFCGDGHDDMDGYIMVTG